MGNRLDTLQTQNQASATTACSCAASALQSSPWVAVTDHLPPPGTEVLFYMPAYRCLLLGSFRPASEYVPTDHFLLPTCEIWPLSKVSHWASLPQHPD
jgi:hypothetical protein